MGVGRDCAFQCVRFCKMVCEMELVAIKSSPPRASRFKGSQLDMILLTKGF